jgi:hypothetical protein
VNTEVNLIFLPYTYGSDQVTEATSYDPLIVYCQYSGTSLQGRYNGSNVVANATPTLNTVATPWYIGFRPDENGCRSAFVCEMIHMNFLPNNWQRQQLEGYLKQKWSVPDGAFFFPHPYARKSRLV